MAAVDRKDSGVKQESNLGPSSVSKKEKKGSFAEFLLNTRLCSQSCKWMKDEQEQLYEGRKENIQP